MQQNSPSQSIIGLVLMHNTYKKHFDVGRGEADFNYFHFKLL